MAAKNPTTTTMKRHTTAEGDRQKVCIFSHYSIAPAVLPILHLNLPHYQ
jgi:hypothetical protein